VSRYGNSCKVYRCGKRKRRGRGVGRNQLGVYDSSAQGWPNDEAGKGTVLQQEQDGLGNSERKEKDTLQKS
jgi:hypothetical protein